MKVKVIHITFNDEVTQEEVNLIDDIVCQMLDKLDIVAVTEVTTEEISDGEA